jgi:hypothetical protein
VLGAASREKMERTQRGNAAAAAAVAASKARRQGAVTIVVSSEGGHEHRSGGGGAALLANSATSRGVLAGDGSAGVHYGKTVRGGGGERGDPDAIDALAGAAAGSEDGFLSPCRNSMADSAADFPRSRSGGGGGGKGGGGGRIKSGTGGKGGRCCWSSSAGDSVATR